MINFNFSNQIIFPMFILIVLTNFFLNFNFNFNFDSFVFWPRVSAYRSGSYKWLLKLGQIAMKCSKYPLKLDKSFFITFNLCCQIKSLFIFSVLTSFFIDINFSVKPKVCLFSVFWRVFFNFSHQNKRMKAFWRVFPVKSEIKSLFVFSVLTSFPC